jgi:acetyl-CoA carboxylase, biotin carboxylase subunit
MIKKVLIANRGEIAVRVMRSCREMGIKSVAVFSEADRKAMHVRYADEAYYIGPSPSNESYLVIDKIIEVAKHSGADAIHPGYGFLSENAEFCNRCKDEGIIFIGPDANAISVMGDKISARQTMIAAGVSVVPGNKENLEAEEEILKVVREIGFPVMVKASAGGGGKGMRLVHTEEELLPAVRGAKSEARTAFGNDAVYFEKYISSPHHIEFQIMGDSHGNVVHLFERECSVQRRHQKVIEETPSPLLTPKMREEMGQQAIMAAKAVNYVGAGTIEFLADDNGSFYFLEMNTRLQVEHPVTERVVGIDLVKEQINVASGKPLSVKQEELSQRGHAIEARIYAEDPDNNFMPSPGVIEHISEPLGLGVRHDGYVYEGYEIPIYYDPMISKLIVWGNTREEAMDRLRRALYAYKITGIKTNLAFLDRIIQADQFISGNYNTHFIDDNIDFLMKRDEMEGDIEDIVFITTFLHHQSKLADGVSLEDDGDIPCAGNQWKNFWKRRGVIRF